jgi:hypothetical protein
VRRVNLIVETKLDRTPRVKQLSGMFDVPAQDKLSHHWEGDLPIDERDWNVGLIVGPSGAGKSSVSRQLFGEEVKFEWQRKSVIDDFPKQYVGELFLLWICATSRRASVSTSRRYRRIVADLHSKAKV